MSESKPIRILLMEDDAGLARLLQKRLEREGYVVELAGDGEQGLAMYAAGCYDVVAVDQKMPVHDGLDAIRAMASQGPLPPTIMVTGSGNELVAVEAMKLGACDYVVKDVDGGYLDLLPTVIEGALRQCRLEQEKRRADEALRKSEGKLRAMFQSIPDHMSMMDKDLNILWANKTAKALFGNDIVGKKCYEVYHQRAEPCDPYVCITLQAFQDGQAHERETQVVGKNGKMMDFHCTANLALREKQGKPAAVLAISRDVTERKRAEETAREAERLRAIRDLAGGVAHNFNNLLTGIMGYAAFVRKALAERNAPLDDIDKLAECAKRTAELAVHLRMAARPAVRPSKVVTLDALVRNLQTACEESLTQGVSLTVNIATPKTCVRVPFDTMKMALLNVCTNAQEAMPDRGTLTITGDTVLREHEGKEARFAVIAINDTGKGISGDVLPKIFDPFFSTKRTVGVGLSLALTRGIVEDNGGTIEVESTPGLGATFRVFLPAGRESVEE